MKKWGEIALGIATSVGGFLDVGSIATSAQAGAQYRFQLLWAVALGSLITLAFVVAIFRLHPPFGEMAHGLVPKIPGGDRAQAGFLVVSILGASLTPYLFYFYSSGAVEDGWDESYVNVNRVVSAAGMTFGGLIAAAVLIVAALVFAPHGIQVDRYEQAGLMLTDAFGKWGFP